MVKKVIDRNWSIFSYFLFSKICYNFAMKSLKSSMPLAQLARRYVWWETPEWALAHPDIFLVNVMDLGSWDDIQLLRKTVGDIRLKAVLAHPPIGYFHYRSWDYWHVKFNIFPIPDLPTREL